MRILKYLLFILMCFLVNNIFADIEPTKIDSVSFGYFVDEFYPSPSSPVLGLKFGIPDTALVTVEIHKVENKKGKSSNIESKKIKTILHKKLSKGMYRIEWNGKDSKGKMQSRGDYCYIYYMKIERKLSYAEGFITMEAKAVIVDPYFHIFGNDRFTKIDSVYSKYPGYFIDERISNPFSPTSDLKFGIPDTALVLIQIHKLKFKKKGKRKYDCIGTEKVKTMLHKKLPKGMYKIYWNAEDPKGKKVESNLYIYYIKIERSVFTPCGKGFIRIKAKSRLFPVSR